MRLSYAQAIGLALEDEMRADETVVAYGEDFSLGYVWPVSRNLVDKFGPGRVFDVPISERLHLGMAVGAAMTGLRPVVEMQFSDFAMLAMDGIINQAAKLRFMSGGQYRVPLVVRLPYGHLRNFAAQHSQTLYSMFAGVPGLQVLAPSTVEEAYSLTRYAIRSDVPTVLFEHKSLYSVKEEVDLRREAPAPSAPPAGNLVVPDEPARAVVIAIGFMRRVALAAAERLRELGTPVSLYCPVNLGQIDFAPIEREIERTGAVVIVDEATQRDPFSGFLAARLYDRFSASLRAPIEQVKAPDAPMPFAPSLEAAVVPDPSDVLAAVERLCGPDANE